MPKFTSGIKFFLEHLDGNGLVITDFDLIGDKLSDWGVALSDMLTTFKPSTRKIREMPLYQAIANIVSWTTPTEKFEDVKQLRIRKFEYQLPHGSGFDSGCKINLNRSTPDKVVIDFSYHHMDSMGGYIGWTNHELIIEPSLVHGFVMDITSGNYDDLDQMGILDEEKDEWYPKSFDYDEDYFYQTFRQALEELVNPYPEIEEQNA